MAAPKGNSFWELRSKHGRDALFTSPELLWEAAAEYFKATESRKWKKKDWVGKDAMAVDRETETPFTLAGFCLYINASRHWYNEFRERAREEKKHDFLEVLSRIENIMFAQKFEGAAVGAFNQNIIARELGLTDKTESKIENTNTNMNVPVTEEEAKAIKAAWEKKL